MFDDRRTYRDQNRSTNVLIRLSPSLCLFLIRKLLHSFLYKVHDRPHPAQSPVIHPAGSASGLPLASIFLRTIFIPATRMPVQGMLPVPYENRDRSKPLIAERNGSPKKGSGTKNLTDQSDDGQTHGKSKSHTNSIEKIDSIGPFLDA